MNRGKGYQVLALMLLIAYLSLITRTISLLVLSLTIAVIVITLLGKDVKERQAGEKQRVVQKNGKTEKRKNYDLILPVSFTIIGVFMTTYGFTGLFKVETILHRFNLMVDEPFVLVFFAIIGLLLAIYGLVMSVKKWLT